MSQGTPKILSVRQNTSSGSQCQGRTPAPWRRAKLITAPVTWGKRPHSLPTTSWHWSCQGTREAFKCSPSSFTHARKRRTRSAWPAGPCAPTPPVLRGKTQPPGARSTESWGACLGVLTWGMLTWGCSPEDAHLGGAHLGVLAWGMLTWGCSSVVLTQAGQQIAH